VLTPDQFREKYPGKDIDNKSVPRATLVRNLDSGVHLIKCPKCGHVATLHEYGPSGETDNQHMIDWDVKEDKHRITIKRILRELFLKKFIFLN